MVGADAMNAFPSLTLALALALAGCATWQPPAEFSDAALRGRAVTRDNQGLRVSAAVLSREDSRSMLGIDLDHSQMQPVWVEVHNATPRLMWLLRTGTDPDYFSPLEVAWSVHTPLGGSANASIDRAFREARFHEPDSARCDARRHASSPTPSAARSFSTSTCSGRRRWCRFRCFLPVPRERGGRPVPPRRRTPSRYPASEVADYSDLAELRAAIERLPCCARRGVGTGRSAERGGGGRARGHRSGDGAAQLSPRCARRRHGSAGLRPRPRRGAAQAGAAAQFRGMDPRVARAGQLRRPRGLPRAGRAAGRRALRRRPMRPSSAPTRTWTRRATTSSRT